MNKIFSEEIFSSAFPFQGPHLIEASAGTGKTYSIQNIYARLIGEVGMRVGEVLVLTYTEAATKELKERLERVLVSWREYLSGDAKALDGNEIERLENLTRVLCDGNASDKTAQDAKAAALGNLQRAIDEFDNASIFTIHGFCRRVIAKYSMETNMPFSFDIAGDAEISLRQAAEDWWRANAKAQKSKFDSTATGFSLEYLKKSLEEIERHQDCTLDTQANTPQDFLLNTAKKIIGEHTENRRERASLSFQDILSAVGDALADEKSAATLAKKLREDYKAALIDEFQDTDSLQYGIFRRIFLDVDERAKDRPPLFFVGDPKQAIYSFRGGDIFTYRQAASRKDVKEATSRLDRNFRSTPKLIEAVNLIFKDDEGHPGSTFQDESIVYDQDLLADESKAPLKENGKDDSAPMRIIKGANKEAMQEAVVQEVLKLLERSDNDIKPGDIAILTTHSSAEEFRKKFSAAGISCTTKKAGNVFAQPIATEFLMLLKTIAQDRSVKNTRAAICGKLFDIKPQELAQCGQNDITSEMRAFFAELEDTWRNSGFEAMFGKLERHEKCRLKENLSKSAATRNMLADILKIYTLCCTQKAQLGPSPEALVNWLADRISKSGKEGPECEKKEYSREISDEASSLKLMTHHASKGLQFPVVFAIIPSREKADTPPFAYHDENGNLHFTNETNNQARENERDAEKTRILYVSLTRATKRTYVAIAGRKSLWGIDNLLEKAKERIEKSQTSSPILWIDVASANDGASSEKNQAQDAEEAKRKAEQELAKIPLILPQAKAQFDFTSSRPAKASYSSLAPHSSKDFDGKDLDSIIETDESPEDIDSETHAIFKLEGGKKIGSCWHEILERVPFAAAKEQIAALTQKTLEKYGLVSTGEENGVDALQTVSEMIGKTLSAKLHSPDGKTFSLAQIGERSRSSEWEFNFSSARAKCSTLAIKAILEKYWRGEKNKAPFIAAMRDWSRPLPDNFLTGFIDLVFEKDGFYYIVDWKSNSLNRDKGNFSPRGILDEMANTGYFFQYILYSCALDKYLKEALGEKYSWKENFGGVKYVFLRGIACDAECSIFEDRPGEDMLNELEEALGLEGGAR